MSDTPKIESPRPVRQLVLRKETVRSAVRTGIRAGYPASGPLPRTTPRTRCMCGG